MKKLLILILCFVFVFSGCSSDTSQKQSESAQSDSKNTIDSAPQQLQPKSDADTVVPELTSNEFYHMATNSNRPIAVMIDNDNKSARPQIGLESAYIVYEIIVEGGASRFMALFKNYDIEKVGPVRSSRHYFLDYALENGAIYAHAGWSPQAQADIANLGINNINGLLGSDEKNYWRDSTYDNTWHNMYTSVKKLAEFSKNSKNYSLDGGKSVLEFSKEDIIPDGTDCTQVDFMYSGSYKVGYKYNEEQGEYERFINKTEHMSQTGKVLTAKNIIIYNVANYDLNDGQNVGRQNLNNIGSGEGWYISMGKAEKITWSKNSRGEKTVYRNSDGNPLTVNPGVTFIQIVPKGNSINMY